MITTISVISLAQTKPANPFGLVYGDAITENVPGKVNIHPVTYNLNGLEISANVYTPANWMPGDPVMLPTTQDFNEAKLRLEGQNGLFCPSWYNCYLDYNSLTQDRNNA